MGLLTVWGPFKKNPTSFYKPELILSQIRVFFYFSFKNIYPVILFNREMGNPPKVSSKHI